MATTPGIDGLALKARVRGILNRHPAVGLAVGVVGNGGLEAEVAGTMSCLLGVPDDAIRTDVPC